jgi:ribosomal protein L16/L10AE
MKKKFTILKKWKIKKKQYTGKPSSDYGDFCIKSLSTLKLREDHQTKISALIRKFLKKKAFCHYRIHFSKDLTNKSLGMRMGKGKGKKKSTIFYIGKGNFFLEINSSKMRTGRDLRLFLSMLSKKLPFKIQNFSKSAIYIQI